ncbi:MAG: ribosome-associated translation inhibitor RaiA [Actinomycetia bacterium]|nr:ribosome-associated translation inhibitor RaiA [Actinomycetes bacterium]
MDITISARRCTVSQAVRDDVAARLTDAIGKIGGRAMRAEVEFTAGEGKGAGTLCEVTLRGKGPVVRGTGSADDKLIAFEAALDKLDIQLRKAADRRKSRRGLRTADMDLSALPAAPVPVEEAAPAVPVRTVAGLEVAGDGPLVVREKVFEATPLTLAQALDEMELVGHDFFLYVDATTRAPSVVYRRKAYDYGVIHLNVAP